MPKKNNNNNKYKCSLLPFEKEEIISIQEASQKSGWEITAFNLPETWKFTEGEGVKIAVLDTGVDLDHQDLVNNILPGKNFVNTKKDPDDDNGHGCLNPSSLIYTTRNGIETIESFYENIKEEELTNSFEDGFNSKIKIINNNNIFVQSLDKDGSTKIGKITHVHKIPINSKIIKITLEGNIKLELTPWHMTFVFKKSNNKIERKRADELLIGDYFGMPDGQPLPFDYQKFNGKIKLYCEKCKKFKKKNICKCGNKVIEISNEYIIDEDMAYLIGIICTKSHFKKRIEITSKSPKTLEKCKIIFDKLKIKTKIYQFKISVHSLCFEKFLHNIGVLNKKEYQNQCVPNIISNSPINVIYSFLAGIIDGNGCISEKNKITNISKKFASELCMLFNCSGASCDLTYNKNLSFSKNNNLPVGIVEKIADPVKKSYFIKNKCSKKIRRIKSLSIKYYNGYFYDFTVEKYNNYIAEGHFISNTHVAGIICAENNKIGMVGIAPKSKIIPVKVLDHKGSGNLLNVANGIRWAADNGVDFITMSLGSPNPVQEVRKAIQYASNKGVVVFCAAGNAGKTSKIFYPANYPETISIGAIDENFDRANFSCTGENLDFLAPGVKIFSTFPNNWYAILSGTSMANPFATGVAALLLSYKRKNNLKIKLENAENYKKIFKLNTIPINNLEFANNKFFSGFGIIDPRKIKKWLEINQN